MDPTPRSTRRRKAAPRAPEADAAQGTSADAVPGEPEDPETPPPTATPRPARKRKPAPTRPSIEPAVASAEPEPASPSIEPSPPPAREADRRRRFVVTGAAGFVGSHVASALLERGDEVVALVRDPHRAGRLAGLGAELVASDLSDVARLTENLEGADAVIHAAGSYKVGIAKSERGAMWDANVGTTTRVLDAAEAARIPRVVHVSTVGAFGNTHGTVVDEGYRRDLAEGFLSWYDETKYGAHEVAEQRIAGGAPIVIVLPSQVYGPGDPSLLGDWLRRASQGRLRAIALDEVGLGFVHVDDLAAGIVAATDSGQAGQRYVLSGPTTRVREVIALAASIGGHAPPRVRIPTGLLRFLAPAARLTGRTNVRELVSAAAGVTHWASAAKAERELGWQARDLESGFRDTFGAA